MSSLLPVVDGSEPVTGWNLSYGYLDLDGHHLESVSSDGRKLIGSGTWEDEESMSLDEESLERTQVIQLSPEDLGPEKALFRMLSWEKGTFQLGPASDQEFLLEARIVDRSRMQPRGRSGAQPPHLSPATRNG